MSLARSCAVLAVVLATVGVAEAARKPAIVSQSELAQYWQPAGSPLPALFRAPDDTLGDVCVSLGFQIKDDGSTSDFSLLNSWGSATPDKAPDADRLNALVQAAAATASQGRFAPSTEGGKAKAVYTSAVFVFLAKSSSSGDPAAIGGHCNIANLKQFIAQATDDEFKRGDLEKSKLERSQREFTPADAAAQQARQRNSRGL